MVDEAAVRGTSAQKEPEIAALAREVQELEDDLRVYIEMSSDLGQGYRDLLEHVLDQEPEGWDAPPESEQPVPGRSLALPTIRQTVRDLQSALRMATDRARSDLNNQRRVYDELIPNL